MSAFRALRKPVQRLYSVASEQEQLRLAELGTQIGAVQEQITRLGENVGHLGPRINDGNESVLSKLGELFPPPPPPSEEPPISPIFVEPDSVNVFTDRRTLADVPNGKIVIFGLQKAGNTWLHSLLADTFDMPYLFYLNEVATPGVLSTHLPFCNEIKFRHDFTHGVCLVRDLRDMIVSYFEYMQTASYQSDIPYAKYADIETFYYDWFLSRLVPAHRFHTYWEEYAERGVPVLRYERLRQDTKAELVRLFERWSQPYDEARLDKAIAANELQALKKTGKQLGDVQIATSHFRKGLSGSYKTELPPAILADVEERFGKVLKRWGYSIGKD